MKQLLSLAAAAFIGLLPAQADVTPVLTPSPSEEVTNLATIKITFDGLEMITKPKLENVSATLVNETTSTKYVCVGVKYTFSEMNAVTMSFGTEGSSDALPEITEDGTYKLTVGAGSFKSETVDPIYYSPVIEATYTIGGETTDAMSNYVLTPASGELAEISSIKVDFPDTGLMGINVVSTDGITLTYTNPSGTSTHMAKVVKSTFLWGSDCKLEFDWEDALIKEPVTFSAAGTYTLDIPAGAFSDYGGNLFSRHIIANYTIPTVGGPMSSYQVRPAAGAVKEISTIELSFGGNEVSSLQFADNISDIKITRKGDMKTVWHCINATTHGTSDTAVLTFAREGSEEPATIDAPGEYILAVPGSVVSGYTTDGRKSNDPIQVVYTIETGANHMNVYTLSPAESTLESIRDIVVTFPDCKDGISYPIDTKKIKLYFTPADSETVTNTYSPNGAQIDGNSVTIVFGDSSNSAFTEKGEYTLLIEEGAIQEYLNNDSYNPEISKAYTVTPQTGVELINENASDKAVYNLQGILVRPAGDRRTLPAGTYISGGRKFIVR